MLSIEILGNDIVLNGDLIVEDNFEPFIELLCVSLAHYFAGDNVLLLAKLRHNAQSIAPKDVGKLGNSKIDTLAVAAFTETLDPVKCPMFVVEKRGTCINY